MTECRYLIVRAEVTSDYITARRASELYAEAQSEPESSLHGDLDSGFFFWSVDLDGGLHLIHFHVSPMVLSLGSLQLLDDEYANYNLPPTAQILETALAERLKRSSGLVCA